MATYLLKKSYQHKDLKEVNFKDLWDSYGVFTTMRVIGKPVKILLFKEHVNNLIKLRKEFNYGYLYVLNGIKKNIAPNPKAYFGIWILPL